MANKVLDLTKEECPIPFIKAMSTLTKLKDGEVLEVLTSDPKCYDMLVEGVKSLDQILEGSEKKDGVFRVVIRRKKNQKKTPESTC